MTTTDITTTTIEERLITTVIIIITTTMITKDIITTITHNHVNADPPILEVTTVTTITQVLALDNHRHILVYLPHSLLLHHLHHQHEM